MKEELAVIKDIQVGMRDAGSPICWFSVEVLYGTSLQVISIKEMEELIKSSECYKLSDLNGKLCIVETDGYKVKFKRLR